MDGRVHGGQTDGWAEGGMDGGMDGHGAEEQACRRGGVGVWCGVVWCVFLFLSLFPPMHVCACPYTPQPLFASPAFLGRQAAATSSSCPDSFPVTSIHTPQRPPKPYSPPSPHTRAGGGQLRPRPQDQQRHRHPWRHRVWRADLRSGVAVCVPQGAGVNAGRAAAAGQGRVGHAHGQGARGAPLVHVLSHF
eukprot:204421-Chlamydomonas_euryale.AAC.1